MWVPIFTNLMKLLHQYFIQLLLCTYSYKVLQKNMSTSDVAIQLKSQNHTTGYPSSIKAPQDLAKNIFFPTPEKAPSEFIMIWGLFWAWSAPSNYSDIRVTLIRVTTKGRPNYQGWNRKLLWWKWSWNTLYKTIMKFQHGVNAATRLWHLAAVITTEGTLTAHKYFITVPQSTYDSWICMVIGMYTPWGFRTHHLRFCFLGLLG